MYVICVHTVIQFGYLIAQIMNCGDDLFKYYKTDLSF